MKTQKLSKLIILAFITAFFSITTKAQTVEITPSYGYQFGSKIDYGRNYIKLQESDQWGVTIGVDGFKGIVTEVSYFHQSTAITASGPNIENSHIADLNADWILVGASKILPVDNEQLRPFVGGGLGMAIFNTSNTPSTIGSIDTEFYFAVSLKAGINYMFNEKIGLNLQGNLMFPIQWGGVYIGTGGGGVSGSSTTLVGGFSGGLVYRLN